MAQAHRGEDVEVPHVRTEADGTYTVVTETLELGGFVHRPAAESLKNRYADEYDDADK